MPPTTLHALKPFLARAEKGNPSFEVVPISHSLSSIPDLTMEKTLLLKFVVRQWSRSSIACSSRMRCDGRRDARQRRKFAGGEVILKLP